MQNVGDDVFFNNGNILIVAADPSYVDSGIGLDGVGMYKVLTNNWKLLLKLQIVK